MFNENNVIKFIIITVSILYFIGYVLFLNNLNNNNENENENNDIKNFLISFYLFISLISSIYLIFYYFKQLYKTENIQKIIYIYLIITCLLNIIGISIIYFGLDEYSNINKININNNNIFKLSFAFAIIFNISNVLLNVILYYFFNNKNNDIKLINFIIKNFQKKYKSILTSK